MSDAEACLRELLREVAREHGRADHSLRLRPITSGGANYTSVLFLATISSPEAPPLELFAKVACISEKLRTRFNVDTMYRVEQTFYNRIYKVWSRLEEKHHVPEQDRLVVPKFYAGDPELGRETVVLENLVTAGYGSYSRFKSIDWEHAAKTVEVLAKIHAFSYVHAKEDPEEFAELVKELKFDLKHDDSPDMKDVWVKMMEGSVAVVDERYQARVREFFESHNMVELYGKFHTPTRAPVIVHGDFRSSNLLFKKQADGLQAIALDFQTMHTGCPIEDLVYFIFMGSDEAFRRQHYHQLVDHYYLQLGLALARFQVEVDEVYPREHFDEDLKEYLPFALIVGVTVLPVVTVEAESAPRTDGDADVDSFVVAPNQLYAERFGGIVNDLVRWGAI